MKRMHWVVGLALLPAATGCYHYAAATPEMIPQGTPVRARLNQMEAFELAQITVNNIDEVEGEMIRADAGSLFLSATWLQAVTGNGYAGNGWTVRIADANLVGFEEKKFSWWRSTAVVAGVMTATWFGFDALGLGPSFGGGGGGTGVEN